MDLDIVSLATLPAILAIVQLLKDLFPNLGKGALVVAVALGILLNVADFLFAADPLYQSIIGGLMLGLGAAGVYDGAKLAGARINFATSAGKTEVVTGTGDVIVKEGDAVRRETPPPVA